MKLVIGDIVIADSDTDSTVVWISAVPGELSFKNDSVAVRNLSYARNVARRGCKVFKVSVTVGRQFATIPAAENFVMEHFSALANGGSGLLKYRDMLDTIFGFENAVLDNATVSRGIGVSTEIKYDFSCGAPVFEFDTAIAIGTALLSLGGKVITIKQHK